VCNAIEKLSSRRDRDWNADKLNRTLTLLKN